MPSRKCRCPECFPETACAGWNPSQALPYRSEGQDQMNVIILIDLTGFLKLVAFSLEYA
jgi:hypothetical protein